MYHSLNPSCPGFSARDRCIFDDEHNTYTRDGDKCTSPGPPCCTPSGQQCCTLSGPSASLFVAGTETTGLTLCWAMYYLIKTPEAFARCRAEALKAAPSRCACVVCECVFSCLAYFAPMVCILSHVSGDVPAGMCVENHGVRFRCVGRDVSNVFVVVLFQACCRTKHVAWCYLRCRCRCC